MLTSIRPVSPQIFPIDLTPPYQPSPFKSLCVLEEHLAAWKAKAALSPATSQAQLDQAGEHIIDCWRSGSKRLDLSDLGLPHLPEAVFTLNHLETLRLSGNQLETLPEFVCALHNLRILEVSRNPIKDLPVGLEKLVNLNLLFLDHTPLPRVPEPVFSLPAHCDAHMRGHQLSKLRLSLARVRLDENQYAPTLRISTIPSPVPTHASAPQRHGKISPPQRRIVGWPGVEVTNTVSER